MKLVLTAFLATLTSTLGDSPPKTDLEETLESLAAELADGADPFDLLEEIEPALERYSDSPRLFAFASDVAHEADEPDRALFWARVALDQFAGDKDHEDRIDALEERLVELDTVAADVADLLKRYDEVSESLFDTGRSASRRKMYVNAVDLLGRCTGTRFERRAGEALDDLYSDPKVQTALMEAKVDVPKPPRSAEETRRIAELDAQHANWDDAYVRETDNFLIKTNMGYDMAEDIASAMEEMSRFFREEYKVRDVPRCDIHVYRARAEFDRAYPGTEPTVRGFYMPGRNLVVTYDPRTDGWPLAGIWATLFHEATHLFLSSITKARIPGWLNEGTACYFEGARLMPNGSVLTNDIPTTRLRGAAQAIEGNQPSMAACISFLASGSPPGEHYPPNWALVYFMQNYEDEKGKRPFLDLYEKFLKSYQKKKPKEEPVELFEKIIIGGSKQVSSLEEFRNVWGNWIIGLHNRRFGGPAKTAEWLEIARTQASNKAVDRALESCRFAIASDPENLALLFEMADLYKKAKNADAAAYHYRKVLRLVYDSNDSAEAPGFPGKDMAWLKQEALARLMKTNKALGQATEAALFELPVAAEAAAEAYVDADLPRSALRILDDAVTLLGGNAQLTDLRDSIARTDDVETRRWRRLDVGEDLLFWKKTGEWWEMDGGIEVTTRGTAFATWRSALPDTFSFEATVVGAEHEGAPIFGLVFGSDSNTGMQTFGIQDYTSLARFQFKEGDIGREGGFPRMPELKKDASTTLRLDIDRGQVTYFLNGNELGTSRFDPKTYTPVVGLMVDALDWPVDDKTAELRFEDVRVFY